MTTTDSADSEDDDTARMPGGWHPCGAGGRAGRGEYRFASDDQNFVRGERSASIEAIAARPAPPNGGFCQMISADAYRGRRVAFSASVRTSGAVPGAHLVVRADRADGRVVALANMRESTIRRDVSWSTYMIVIDIPQDAAHMLVGGMLLNTGKMWIDDASLVMADDWALSEAPGDLTGYPGQFAQGTLSSALVNPDFEHTVPVKSDGR